MNTHNKTETESQMQRTNRWLLVGGGNTGMKEWEVQLLGIRQAQGCIVQHREYSQYFYNNCEWKVTFKNCIKNKTSKLIAKKKKKDSQHH